MASPNGTAAPDDPQLAAVLAVLGEVLMETYRTSAKVKLLMRQLSDDMTDEVNETRDTVRQALEAIAEGDVKARVEQLARRLDARGVQRDDDRLKPLSDVFSVYLDPNAKEP